MELTCQRIPGYWMVDGSSRDVPGLSHTCYFYYLLIVVLFQKFQNLFFRPSIAVKHQCEMTTFFHRDKLCPWDILNGKLSLLEGDQGVITGMQYEGWRLNI